MGSGLLSIEGLPHRVVTNVIEDSRGNLWVTTHRGLSKLGGAVNDPARASLVHFDVHDGLQGSEFSRGAALKARDGRLFFGGPRGFNVFSPEIIRINTEPPPVVLTNLSGQKLEALGILAGGIAHDFNNLLTGIFGYLDMAKRAGGDSPEASLGKARELMDKARGLTGQLLTFARQRSRAGHSREYPITEQAFHHRGAGCGHR